MQMSGQRSAIRPKISPKLLLSLLAVGVLFIASAGYAIFQSQGLRERLRTVEMEVYPSLDLVNQLLRSVQDTDHAFREAMAARDPGPLKEAQRTAGEFAAQADRMNAVMADSEMAEIGKLFGQYVDVGQATVQAFLHSGSSEGMSRQLAGVDEMALRLNTKLREVHGLRDQRLKDTLAEVEESGTTLSLTVFVATAVGLVFGMVLAVVITRGPISLLAGAARQIGRGNLSARVVIPRGDELRELANTFNRMAEDLQQTTVSRDEVDKIFKSMINALIVVDPDRTIRTVNPATTALLGYREDELIGQPIARVFAQDPSSASWIDEIVQQGAIKDVEKTYRTKEDRDVPVLFSGSVMRDEAGAVQGVVCVAQDITERKRTEEQLRKTAAELARSNSELEQFAYVASHDLQEPLRKVSSYTELLARRYQGRLDANADRFIAYAVDGVARMRALIDDLLTYSRVGRGDLAVEPVALAPLMAQTLIDLEAAIHDSGAVVTYDPAPTVMANPSQLHQVLQNLIGNAIKFHGPAPPPRIHVSATRQGHEWVCAVRDNGIGLEPQYAERIFVIFQRLHTRAEYPGTGIGLAICKKIAERHGGRIWVESQVGQGATFYVALPA